MSSFFLRPTSVNAKSKGSKNKRFSKPTNKRQQLARKDIPRPKRSRPGNEEIHSDSGSEEEAGSKPEGMYSLLMEGVEEEETAQEKRLRLAKVYLSQLEEKEREQQEDKMIDHDVISHRLKEEVLKTSGRLMKTIADTFSQQKLEDVKYIRGHKFPLTCVTVSDKFVFSSSKDGCIIKYDLQTGFKLGVISGTRKSRHASVKGAMAHSGQVLAVAVSSDEKFLASGGEDRAVRIWDAETCRHIHSFNGHRNTVTGLVFRKDSHQLFTCSTDKVVKLWNIDEMSFVEAHFDHDFPVTSIDCLAREKPVSCGGSGDKSVIAWKVVEDSRLAHNGHQASIDCIKLVNDEHFVTGSQDGMIGLWTTAKRRPLVYKQHSATAKHGGSCVCDTWVSAVTAVPFSDLVASGSSDGQVQLWKCTPKQSLLEPVLSIPVQGCVNHLCFSPCGGYLVAAVGREHKFGRWWCDRSARDRLVIVNLTAQTVQP